MNFTRMLCNRAVRSVDIFEDDTFGMATPARLVVRSNTRTGHSIFNYDFNPRIRASLVLDASYLACRTVRLCITGYGGWPRMGPLFISNSAVQQQLWFELRLKRSRYYKEMQRYSR